MQNTSINIALRQDERIGVWILSFYILFIHHPSCSLDITYQFGPPRSHLDHGATINDAKAAHLWVREARARQQEARQLPCRCSAVNLVELSWQSSSSSGQPPSIVTTILPIPANTQSNIHIYSIRLFVSVIGEWNANSIIKPFFIHKRPLSLLADFWVWEKSRHISYLELEITNNDADYITVNDINKKHLYWSIFCLQFGSETSYKINVWCMIWYVCGWCW